MLDTGVENEIISILDEIDERFAASKYYGPDPDEIRRLRFKLALAERRHITSVVTDHVIERFCSVHPAYGVRWSRTQRWSIAADEMEWLEGPVCPTVIGAEGRSATVLRAAQEIIAAIRALPNGNE